VIKKGINLFGESDPFIKAILKFIQGILGFTSDQLTPLIERGRALKNRIKKNEINSSNVLSHPFLT
jgi:hypothetical protein